MLAFHMIISKWLDILENVEELHSQFVHGSQTHGSLILNFMTSEVSIEIKRQFKGACMILEHYSQR